MKKRIIAMLLAVTMCIELLAGCGTATVTSTIVGVEENKSSEGQNDALETSLSVSEKTSSLDGAKESEEGQGANEESKAITAVGITDDEILYAGTDGVVRGQVIMADGARGIEGAILTVKDAKGKVVSVQPCKIVTKEEEIEVPVADNYTVPVFAGGWASSYPDDVYYVTRTESYDVAEDAGSKTSALKTGENGEFLFRLPKEGEYTISVEAEKFYDSGTYTVRWYTTGVSEEDFKNAVWEGIQEGLGKMASAAQMEEWFAFLNEKDEAQWLATFAEAGVSEEESETLLRKMETEKIRLSLIQNMTQEKFWRLAEGISLEQPRIKENHYELDSFFVYDKAIGSTLRNFIDDAVTRRAILENYDLLDYYRSDEGKEEGRALLKNITFEMGTEVAAAGVGLIAKPTLQVASKTILLRGSALAKAVGLADEVVEASEVLIKRTEAIASGTEGVSKRVDELEAIAKHWDRQAEQATTDAQRVLLMANAMAVRSAAELLQQGGTFGVRILDDVTLVGSSGFTGFTSSISESIELTMSIPTEEMILKDVIKELEKQGKKMKKNVPDQIKEVIAVMDGWFEELQTLLKREDVGSKEWQSARNNLIKVIGKRVTGYRASSGAVAKCLLPYVEQQNMVVQTLVDTVSYIEGPKATGIRAGVTRTAKLLDTEGLQIAKENLQNVVWQEMYLQRAEEIVEGYLTGRKTREIAYQELATLHKTANSASIAADEAGEKTVFSEMKRHQRNLFWRLKTAMEKDQRDKLGAYIEELSQTGWCYRSIFDGILRGEFTDMTSPELISLLTQNNLDEILNQMRKASYKTWEEYHGTRVRLESMIRYLQKLSNKGAAEAKTQEHLIDAMQAVRNKMCLDYAQDTSDQH